MYTQIRFFFKWFLQLLFFIRNDIWHLYIHDIYVYMLMYACTHEYECEDLCVASVLHLCCVYVHTNMSVKTLYLHPHNGETVVWSSLVTCMKGMPHMWHDSFTWLLHMCGMPHMWRSHVTHIMWRGPESENSNIKTLNPNPEFLKGFSVGGANNVEVLIGGPDWRS